MQVIPFSFILLVLSCLITSATQMYTAAVITDSQPSVRAYLWFASLLTIHALLMMVLRLRDHPLMIPFSLLCTAAPLYLGFRVKGWRLIYCFLISYVFLMLGDILLGALCTLTLEGAVVEAIRYYQTPFCLIAQLVLFVIMYLLMHLYTAIRHRRARRENLSVLWRCLRIVLMLIIITILFARVAPETIDTVGQKTIGFRLLPEMLIIALLTGVTASYVLQDLRYTLLFRQNKALAQQQEMQDLLLRRSRMFHHNLANVLCGLQGTIHSRDFSSIDAYCDEIVKRCQMINNENVQALRQIPRPAVCMLIQQKILDANEAGVPFYVHADDGLHWRGWRDGDMCQLLGVLLDNALEAASAADAPYISLELHDLRGAMELVVRNTWGSTKSAAPAVSTAPARGLGLPSVQTLLKRYPRTTFSLYHRDRYVEAHLIF